MSCTSQPLICAPLTPCKTWLCQPFLWTPQTVSEGPKRAFILAPGCTDGSCQERSGATKTRSHSASIATAGEVNGDQDSRSGTMWSRQPLAGMQMDGDVEEPPDSNLISQ